MTPVPESRGTSFAKGLWLRALLVLGLALQLPLAEAIDLRPGEARAPMPGVNFVQVRWQESDRDGRYVNGALLPGDRRISASIRALRVASGFSVGDYPAVAYLEVPQGEIRGEGLASSLGSDSGLGDAAAVFGIWPYVDREAKRYFGVGAYLIMPTGSYSSERTLNMGENRVRTALQAAAHAALIGPLEGMVAADVLWFGKNDDYTPNHFVREQKALYSTQAGLLYQLTPTLDVSASYFLTLGGEDRFNGVRQDNAMRVQRYQVSAHAVTPVGLFILQYGADLDTRNGYFEKNNLILRYALRF